MSPDEARSLAQELILVDGHIDVPHWLNSVFEEDIAVRTIGGDFDYPRAREGGLDAAFMAIYLPPTLQDKRGPDGAKAHADRLIDRVETIIDAAPDKFAPARTPDDIRRNHERTVVSLPMGLENAAAIEDDLANLKYFRHRGVRYMTLTHGKDNSISDSSYDNAATWGGLSPFGKDVVQEMNRLGLLVDVSHVSDEAFYQIIEISSAPVAATHSSARHFTPGWQRNMSDEMIEALAQQGGVVMVNFGSDFLKKRYAAKATSVKERVDAELRTKNLKRTTKRGYRLLSKHRTAHPVGNVDDVADHCVHIAELVGTEHIGLGSDFDGVFCFPKGLQDVSHYPNLIRALSNRGFDLSDLRKICGENFLRVWKEVLSMGG